MHHRLPTAFRDVAVDELCFRTDGPVRPALAVLRAEALGGELELRLLGASHQALLRVDDQVLSELVACGVGAPGLPSSDHRTVGPLRCGFESEVRTGGAAATARRLRDRFADDPTALVGEFPGAPDALTVLSASASADRCTWHTWHVYPQCDQVAVTATTVDVLTTEPLPIPASAGVPA